MRRVGLWLPGEQGGREGGRPAEMRAGVKGSSQEMKINNPYPQAAVGARCRRFLGSLSIHSIHMVSEQHLNPVTLGPHAFRRTTQLRGHRGSGGPLAGVGSLAPVCVPRSKYGTSPRSGPVVPTLSTSGLRSGRWEDRWEGPWQSGSRPPSDTVGRLL